MPHTYVSVTVESNGYTTTHFSALNEASPSDVRRTADEYARRFGALTGLGIQVADEERIAYLGTVVANDLVSDSVGGLAVRLFEKAGVLTGTMLEDCPHPGRSFENDLPKLCLSMKAFVRSATGNPRSKEASTFPMDIERSIRFVRDIQRGYGPLIGIGVSLYDPYSRPCVDLQTNDPSDLESHGAEGLSSALIGKAERELLALISSLV